MGSLCYSAKSSKNIPDKTQIIKEENLHIDKKFLVKKSHINPLDKYTIVRLITQGSSAKIFLVQHKEIKIQRVMKEITLTSSTTVESEIELLKSLDHPNILKIYEYFYIDDKLWIVLDYCKDGDLFEVLKVRKVFKERESTFIIYQILMALNYCHSMNIIHRDIKPENVMITNIESNGHYLIKLIDFDSAILKTKAESTEIVGSYMYVAPEAIKGKYIDKSDIWSAGVILYVLLSGYLPFLGGKDVETMKLILESQLEFDSIQWKNTSTTAIDLIRKMLEKDPDKRISAEQALKHPWIVSLLEQEKLNYIKPERFNFFLDNLRNFKNNYKIQQVGIMIIVHNLPQIEDIKEIEKAFRKMDIRNKGKLDKDELKNGFNLTNKNNLPDDDELDAIFKNCDTDANGFVGYEEFICACIDKKKLLNYDLLKLAFNFFDIDGSGVITLKELQSVLSGGGEILVSMDLIIKMVGDIDKNSDGRISFEEFERFMKRLLSNRAI